MPVVTVVVVPVDIVGIEVDVPRVVRVVRIERRRPVVAVGTDIVEIGVVPVTRGGKERLSADRLTGGGVPPLTFSEEALYASPDGPDLIEFTPHSAASAPFKAVTAFRRDADAHSAPSSTVALRPFRYFPENTHNAYQAVPSNR